MDEYAEYIYKRKPSYRHINPGDISEQTALRNKLQCKPFKWFMENVAFDLPKKYPPVEPPNFGDGFIKSLMDSNMCADATDTAFTKRYILKNAAAYKNLEGPVVMWWALSAPPGSNRLN